MRCKKSFGVGLWGERKKMNGRKSSGFVLRYIYNAPRKTKPKDLLRFIFFRLPRKPKPKDLLQLIWLIFYFEYPLKTWGNPFFATCCSLHKPKPKDFLQLIFLIFYFEYPLKTWGNPFLPHTVHFINQNQRIFYNSFNWFFTLNIL